VRIAFRQVRWLDPATNSDSVVDLTWDRNSKSFVEAVASPDRVIEGEGRLILGSALTDLYATSGEPGQEERESLKTLAASARAGGYGSVAILPNVTPPVDDPGQLDFIRKHWPDALVYGAISHGLKGQSLSEVGYLAEAGVVGFTDNQPIQNWALLRRFLDYAQILQKPVLLWPWLPELATGSVFESVWATEFGLTGTPPQAETIALSGLLELMRLSRTSIHLMRISTARSVDLIRQAKLEGLPISASTTIHHLSHTSPELTSYDPNLRFNPPLGSPEDRDALVTGLEDGTLDAVASDHTPWTYEEKTLPFAQAPPGSISLEFTLPLLWNHVRSGNLSAIQAWKSLSSSPRKILNLPTQTALTLFDPDLSWTVENLQSRSRTTSWLGKTIQGKVLELFE
jgi:dihydroorotase